MKKERKDVSLSWVLKMAYDKKKDTTVIKGTILRHSTDSSKVTTGCHHFFLNVWSKVGLHIFVSIYRVKTLKPHVTREALTRGVCTCTLQTAAPTQRRDVWPACWSADFDGMMQLGCFANGPVTFHYKIKSVFNCHKDTACVGVSRVTFGFYCFN